MYALKTLADCQQSLADRHDNGVVPTSSVILAKYTRLINRGIEYCADKLRLSKNVTVTIASGVGDLPDDFIVANTVFLDQAEYTRVDPADPAMQVGMTYWITGNQTDGFVLNMPDDGDYAVNYSFKPTWLSGTTDVCIIPDIEAPVSYAYAMLRKSESDPFEDAEMSLIDCDDRIREMSSQTSVNSDAIGFTLE